MATVIIGIILLISYILETSVLAGINFFGTHPSLVLVVVICYSMINGKEKGTVMGLIVGLIIDILNSSILGINTLLYTYVAALSGFLADKLFGKNPITSMVISFIASLTYGIIFSIALYITKLDRNIIYLIFARFFPGAVYNAIISFFMYLLIDNIWLNFYRRLRG